MEFAGLIDDQDPNALDFQQCVEELVWYGPTMHFDRADVVGEARDKMLTFEDEFFSLLRNIRRDKDLSSEEQIDRVKQVTTSTLGYLEKMGFKEE